MGRHFSNGKNSLVLFYKYYGWTLLCKNIANPTSTCCTKDVWGELALQQDNDPKHTSRVAKEFIAENSIHLIDWPSNSPDINPIENMWQIMKNNVEKRMPRNTDELMRFMIEEWDAIP